MRGSLFANAYESDIFDNCPVIQFCKGSFTPDLARHGTFSCRLAGRRAVPSVATAWYSAAVAAFTLEFSICIALQYGSERHRDAPCRAGAGVKVP